jgi:uncharacterized HAD superfamily protein
MKRKQELLEILKNPRYKTIAVDVDGFLTLETVFTEEEMRNATPNKKVIDLINDLHEVAVIYIYTARRAMHYQVTKDWLDKNGVRYHAIVTDKMPAHCYLDDSALNIDDLPIVNKRG